jgi:hypothetical protein
MLTTGIVPTLHPVATTIRLDVETEQNDTEVWLLLSRHLTTTGSAASPESVALHVRETDHGSTNTLSNSSMASETAEGVSGQTRPVLCAHRPDTFDRVCRGSTPMGH